MRISKLFFILFVILIAANIVKAQVERVTLDNEESFLFDGKNITLVDSSEDSVIICVNKVKAIISDEKTIEGVLIRRVDSSEGSAEFRFEYDCENDCKCNGDECNNNVCFAVKSVEITTSETTAIDEAETTTTINVEKVTGEVVKETSSESNETVKKVTYAMIGVAVILGIAAFSRKKKQPDEEEIVI